MQFGLLQRKRGIHSVYDLLKIFFLSACSPLSFRLLAVAACSLGLASISDTALRKQFSKATSFLHELLRTMLSTLFPKSIGSLPSGIKKVLLVDASIVRQIGKEQKQERIHLCYHLNQNRMEQIKVTTHHIAESLCHFFFQKGDLVLADACYGTARNFLFVQKNHADAILRITPNMFCFYDQNEKKLSFVSLLEQAEKQKKTAFDQTGQCRCGKEMGRVRVVAQKLPKEAAEQARKRKRKKASRNQNTLSPDTLFCAGWIVLIPTLGKEHGVEEIVSFYRSRWQIELLFKRWKQSFVITVTKAGSESYAETLRLLQLIVWLLVERQAFLCECYWKEKEETEAMSLSLYENCKLAFEQIKTILCLSWSLFFDPKDEKYRRFLSKRKWKRIDQNEAFRSAILKGFLA